MLGLLGLVGCSDLDVLEAEFADELVEAQARSIELKVADNTDCEALLRVEHAQIETVANVVATRSTRFPIDPESGVLEDLPRNRPLIFDLVALDQESRQIARACEGITLPEDPTDVTLTMRALPPCESEPNGLDVAIVLDASVEMRNANASIGAELVDRLSAFLDSGLSPGGDRWTLITHGPSEDPIVAVPFTENRDSIISGIESAAADFTGKSRLFDAVRLGTILLRSRAVCGRRPTLLVLAGGFDEGPLGGRELAIAGLAGDRSTPDDDLFGVGVGISTSGKDALDLILVEELGITQVALTAESLTAALLRTRERFQGFVGI